jgi:protein-S-isoprenylcysteine O-methyltransferase Ste14
MKKIGKPSENREDETLFKFEKTTVLIESGIYKYIRHPLYGSLIFLTWGIFLKNISYELLIISVLSSLFLFITVKIEEKENVAYFGEKYIDYMKKSKMFVPFLI